MDLIGQEPRICPWLHVPAQSGSDRVLRRMKRLYTRDQYLQMVAHARANIPGVTFSSDFIVGFPGETAADFEQTLTLLQEVRFDSIFAFKYSPRPGVPAARLDDDVPQAEKERRLAALHAAQSAIWAEIATAAVGEVWQAVVEGPARRPAGHWRLRTPANRKVVAALTQPEVGQTLPLRITGWRHTTFLGEPV
jgi:tRNA-2-methylthio-N6-dimethylallyladenosine synthase